MTDSGIAVMSECGLASTARKYIVQCSASIDPFEVPEINAEEDAAENAWLRHVESELAGHRSPFIAAEAILEQMKTYAATRVRNPQRLYEATACPVLNGCLAALTPEYRDVVSAAMAELAPAMAFTRMQPGLTCTSSASGARRVTYAECFWHMYKRYKDAERALATQKHREEVENTVMDRVVLSLDRLWIKMCFLSWRIHCRQIHEKKFLFRKLAARGMAGHIAPKYIRAWRQHAHTITLNAKIARSGAVARELEALYPQEDEAKRLHQHLNEEVREKMRLLKDATLQCEQTEAKLVAVRHLRSETQRSLESHWSIWQSCMRAMFGDALPARNPEEESDSARITYLQNITDTSELYRRRARARLGKVGLPQIEASLQAHGLLPDHDEPAAVGNARQSAETGVTRCGGEPSTELSAGRTTNALAAACAPVASPMHLDELLRGEQSHASVVLSFLSCMYNGGHCSLFTPSTRDRGVSDDAGPPVSATGEPERQVPLPEEVGAQMIEDVETGMRNLAVCSTANDHYLLSIRRCLESNPLDAVQQYLGTIFSRWSAMGLPLCQERIEVVMASLVRLGDAAVINALYPASGINTFSEFTEYITKIAEYSGRSLLHIAERLENDYPFTPMEEILYTINNSDDVQQLFRASSDNLVRLLDALKDEQSPSQLSAEKGMTLLTRALGLSTDQAGEVWHSVESEENVVETKDLNQFLYIAALHYNPSPFTPPAKKLAEALSKCVSFVLEL